MLHLIEDNQLEILVPEPSWHLFLKLFTTNKLSKNMQED
jgi:hypothetical protein